MTTSSKPTWLDHWAKLLSWGGLAVLLFTLWADRRVAESPITTTALALVVLVLRLVPVRLSKFSYLTQTGVVALSGGLLLPPGVTATAIYLGTVGADWLMLKKRAGAAAVNAGREVLAFATAIGSYYAAWQLAGTPSESIDLLPALAALAIGYFIASRLLFYFSMLVRGVLDQSDRAFLLRWEMFSYLITMAAAGLVVWSVTSLDPLGWLAMALALGVLGTLAKTLLEEAAAAEDLNKVYLAQATLSRMTTLKQAFGQLEDLAYRLIDWGDLVIFCRTPQGALAEAYRAQAGWSQRNEPAPQLDHIRAAVLQSASGLIIPDAQRDAQLAGLDPRVRCIMMMPLIFGGESLGVVELLHHKRNGYGPRDLAALNAIGAQISTAIHIAGLRRPLIETVHRLGNQINALAEAVEALRSSGTALNSAAVGMGRTIRDQEAFIRAGLSTTEQLRGLAEETSRHGASSSGLAEDIAAGVRQYRATIEETITRLLAVAEFVSRNSQQVSELGSTAKGVAQFLGTIQDLSELINVVALNATLQAERAGAEGVGFAVLAEEIQRLATLGEAASQEAGGIVADIGAKVEAITLQMETGLKMVVGVGKIGEAASAGLNDMAVKTEQAAALAQRIAIGAAGQENAGRQLASQIEELAAAMQRTKEEGASVSRQAAAATRSQAELERVIHDLETLAQSLRAMVRQFSESSAL